MDHQLICTWLGLSADAWPPEHYTLLGLPPGEADPARIEQHVHERLARVRCYQLSHPGPATEAMNRLAQAFVCLCDPQAKKAYDAEHFPHLASAAAAQVVEPGAAPAAEAAAPAQEPATAAAVLTQPQERSNGETDAGTAQAQLDWHTAAPPVRAPAMTDTLPGIKRETALINGTATAAAPAAESTTRSGAIPVARPADPVFEAARSSPEARRGLGTRRGLYERIVWLRQLLRAWERAGRFLGKPRRNTTRPAEDADLLRQLADIDELLLEHPSLLGEPGQPGYRVLVLAHADKPAEELKGYDLDQRDALAKDWKAGHTWLWQHRQFLRRELKALRRCSWCMRGLRAVNAALTDHARWVYLALIAASVVVTLLLLF